MHPHPVIDPKGHSYKKEEEKPEYLPPEKWKQNDLYLYGIDLFNNGYWWEAHEAWETIWLTTPKTDLEGQYLQGLIQFSASLLKLFSGSEKGFQNLLRESQKRFHFCLKEMSERKMRHFMGLDLENWIKNIETFCSCLEPSEGKETDALHFTSFPALILES
ncbi:MAG: DUF309 domain-containing protein [Deltaproteobacteria bacterium]|nr:DUF309 domain-containing protein [Deltaproteobacteria bacterium]